MPAASHASKPCRQHLSYEVNPGEASTFLCDATGIINKGPKPGWCPAPDTPRRRPAVECRTARPRTKTCRIPDRSTTRRLHVDALDDAVVTCHACLTRNWRPLLPGKLLPRCHLHWCSRGARGQMAGRWTAQCGPRSSNPGIGILIDDPEGQDGDRASLLVTLYHAVARLPKSVFAVSQIVLLKQLACSLPK